MESLIDSKTKAILVNNPSNPTGSNYSRAHLLDILRVAHRHRLPIIADEIYAHMVWNGPFYALADLSDLVGGVPILSCGGIAKRFLVPGWRLGWVAIYDRHNAFKEVKEACNRLAQLLLGANSLVQAALPEILSKCDASYYDTLNRTLQNHSETIAKRCNAIPGLQATTPQGAMYLMVRVDCAMFGCKDDRDFAQKLLSESLVFVLPGACFQAPGFIRIVYCAPIAMLLEAADRMVDFCNRHRRASVVSATASTSGT